MSSRSFEFPREDSDDTKSFHPVVEEDPRDYESQISGHSIDHKPHAEEKLKETGEKEEEEEEESAGDGTVASEQVLHGMPLLLCGFALLMCMLVHALDGTIVTTILTQLGEQFGDFGMISWVVSGYMLPQAVLAMSWSKISMVFGRKWAMILSVCWFEIGSLIAALAKNMSMLIVGRVVSGIGGGGIAILVFMIMTEIVTIDKRGLVQGLVGASFGIASVVGPLLGGALAKITWRWIFYINLPIGGVAITLIWFFFNPPLPKGTWKEKLSKIDYLGSFLLGAGLTLTLLAMTFGSSTKPWDSPIVIAFFVVGGALIIIYFVYNFTICKNPMLPWEVVKVPQVLAASFALLCVFCGFMMAILYLSIFFQVVLGDDPMHSGLQLLPLIIPMIITSIISGGIISKTRIVKPFAIVGTALAAIGVGVLTLLDENTGGVRRAGLMVIPGIGVGLTFQSITLGAQIAAPKAGGGVLIATAMVGFGRAIGGSIGSTIGQTIQSVVFKAQLAGIQIPAGFSADTLVNSPEMIRELPPAVTKEVIQGFVFAYQRVMYAALAFHLAGFIAACFMTNKMIPKPIPKKEDEEEKAADQDKAEKIDE